MKSVTLQTRIYENYLKKTREEVEKDARENLDELVYKVIIPRNVRVSEAPSYAMPVLAYDTGSKGATAYRDMAIEFLKNNQDT